MKTGHKVFQHVGNTNLAKIRLNIAHNDLLKYPASSLTKNAGILSGQLQLLPEAPGGTKTLLKYAAKPSTMAWGDVDDELL